MAKTIKKTFLIIILFFTAVSFSGCINLSVKPEKEKKTINESQGVFKSIDGGKTWEHKVKAENNEFIDSIKISSMRIDPQNNDVLYLGTTGNGLYKSEDGANSWKKIADENGILSGAATIYDIAIEKGNSDIVYLATLNGDRGELLKSENGGEKWTESYIISELNKPVNTVEIDPINNNVIYIGTEQGGFMKSENRGATWATLNWFEAGVKDVVIDFRNNNGMIMRTSNEILKSVDRGNKWESLNEKIINSSSVAVNFGAVSSTTMDNRNPLVIYINYLNLILRTKDGGYNWEKLNTITPSLTAIGTIPQVKQIGLINDIIYYGAGNVIYKSENKGVNWSSYNIPIKGDVRYTVSDYINQEVIYVGAFYDPPPKPKKKGFF